MRLLLITLAWLATSLALPYPKQKGFLSAHLREAKDVSHVLEDNGLVNGKHENENVVATDSYGPPGYEPGAPLGNGYLPPVVDSKKFSTPLPSNGAIPDVVQVHRTSNGFLGHGDTGVTKTVTTTSLPVSVTKTEEISVTPPTTSYGVPIHAGAKSVQITAVPTVHAEIKTRVPATIAATPAVKVVEEAPLAQGVTHYSTSVKTGPTITRNLLGASLLNDGLSSVRSTYGLPGLGVPTYPATDFYSGSSFDTGFTSGFADFDYTRGSYLSQRLPVHVTKNLPAYSYPETIDVHESTLQVPQSLTHTVQHVQPWHGLESLPSAAPLDSFSYSPVHTVDSYATVEQPVHRVEHLEQVHRVHSVAPVQQVQSFETVQQVESLEPVHRVHSVAPVHSLEPVQRVEKLQPLPQVHQVHSLSTVQPVHQVHQVQRVEKLEPVHRVQSLETVHQAQSLEPAHELHHVDNLEPVHHVHSVAPVHQVHSVAPVQSVQQVANLESVHQAHSLEPAHQLHHVDNLESVHHVENLEPVHHVHSVAPVQPVQRVEKLQQVHSLQPVHQVHSLTPAPQPLAHAPNLLHSVHQQATPVETVSVTTSRPAVHAVTELAKTRTQPGIEQHVQLQKGPITDFLQNLSTALPTLPSLPSFGGLAGGFTTAAPTVEISSPSTHLSTEAVQESVTVEAPLSPSEHLVKTVSPANEYVQPTDANGGYIY